MHESGEKSSFVFLGAAAALSAFGWFAVDKWIPADSALGSSIAVSVLRTIFTLLPAGAAFLIANRRQKAVYRSVASRLTQLKAQLVHFQRVRRIEHELHTMDRLSKVAREAVKNTASSAKELFGAIESVGDPRIKERLVDRYRTHTNSVVTVLTAVSEQMEESGRAIERELTADEQIHVLDRERQNATKGIEYARDILDQRGIAEGMQQLQLAGESAKHLQQELTNLLAISASSQEDDRDEQK